MNGDECSREMIDTYVCNGIKGLDRAQFKDMVKKLYGDVDEMLLGEEFDRFDQSGYGSIHPS